MPKFHACLPPHSDRPLLQGPPPPPTLAELSSPLLQSAKGLLAELETTAVEPDQLFQSLRRLAQQMAPLVDPAQGLAPRIARGPTPASQRVTQVATREREGDNVLETYRIYDDHFLVRRLRGMTWIELAAQAILVLHRTLGDLPKTLLGREQYRALLASIIDMIELLLPASTSAAVSLGAGAPQQEHDPVQDRWRNGHHLFGLCCYFSREYLARAIVAVETDDLDLVCHHISKAALHLLGSSATMVYTTDFPSKVYRETIRSAMPAGFSGTHNSDFNHLKMWKGKLHVALLQKWGKDPQSWPLAILRAASHFRAIDLLDVDYHVVVAASRVGLSPSLKQEENHEDLSALDGLRHLSASRARDFNLNPTHL